MKVESLLPFEGLATVQAEARVDFLALLDLRRNVAGGGRQRLLLGLKHWRILNQGVEISIADH